MDLAESLLALDRAAEGLALAEQGWDGGKGNALTPEHRATSALILAELRWVTATDARGRQAAREAAKAALATYADWPEAPADAVAKVQRWLDGHA
jgi:hypothetical protein